MSRENFKRLDTADCNGRGAKENINWFIMDENYPPTGESEVQK
jgi:hypothetical protein